MDMTNIKLYVHLRASSKILDMTKVVGSVIWGGAYNTASRTLEFTIAQSTIDREIERVNILEGSTCCFYVDNVEIFRGSILDIDKDSSNNTQKFTAKDIGHRLNNEVKKNYTDKTATEVARDLISYCGLPVGNIVKTNEKFTKILAKTTAYNGIMTFFTLQAEKDKKAYMIDVDIDKINVIEKGTKLFRIKYKESENLIKTDYSASIKDMVNKIVIIDKQGKEIRQEVNAQWRKLYGFYMQKVEEETDSKKITSEDAKKLMKDAEKKCSLTGIGNIECKTGMKVHVEDEYTGLVGVFYIDEDKHSWNGGNYTIDLVLNFENIMDKHNDVQEKEENATGTGTATTKDWGHGVKAEQLNKLLKGKLSGTGDIFIKYCNMYKINPALAAAISMHESANGTSKMATDGRNNFFGMRNKNGWMHFNSIEEGIKAGIRNISINYVNKGKNTLDKMVGAYAEGGGNWIPETTSFFKKITGKNPSNFGTGVRSDEEARANIVYEGSSGGNSIVEKAIAFAESKIGYRYSQPQRMTAGAFDCSSLCYRAYASAGVYNPSKWAFTTYSVSSNPAQYGLQKIPLSQAKRGDMVWKQGHMGLYIGNGQTIEAMCPSLGVRKGKIRNFTVAYRYVGK